MAIPEGYKGYSRTMRVGEAFHIRKDDIELKVVVMRTHSGMTRVGIVYPNGSVVRMGFDEEVFTREQQRKSKSEMDKFDR